MFSRLAVRTQLASTRGMATTPGMYLTLFLIIFLIIINPNFQKSILM